MAEPEYPVLKELETKLKLQWIDTDDIMATQRAIIQVEPELAYLELPRGRKGDKGDAGPAISIQGIITADSQLPANAEVGHAYVNTRTKGLAVWNGSSWFKVDNFAGVDADVQQFSRWFAQIESDTRRAIDAASRAATAANRAEFAAEETIQQVEGDFATRNYVDSELETLEPRLLGDVSTEDLSFAVVDDNNRRTWLEVAKDGGPTDYARSLIGNTGGGDTAGIPDFPIEDWAHWGDSNTDSYHLGEDSWTSQLAQLTGKNHYMGGYYSQKSINIAARQGGAPSLVTVAGNVTAASGATQITEAVNPVTGFSRAYDITGTLAGVHGWIRPLADEKQSFIPTIPGVYDIPPRSVFTPDAASMRDRHMTIWMGRNDRWDDGAPQQVTRSARHMVDYLSPRVKRFLILQLVPGTDGLDDPLVKSVNDMLKAEFPSQFVPIAEWMMTDRAADLAGITYTEQDLTDIAAGRIPTSFRSDNAHFNGVGCTAIAHFLHEEILKRGWL